MGLKKYYFNLTNNIQKYKKDRNCIGKKGLKEKNMLRILVQNNFLLK